jgi:hypothetical protein
MKKLIQFNLLLTGLILLTNLQTYSQVLNGDFSNWAPDSIGRTDVVGWETTNVLYSQPSILQDTDRTSMTGYSVKMTTVFDSTIMDYNVVDMILNNTPFSNPVNPATLSGYWKFNNPNFNDLVAVEVNVYDSANNRIGTKNINTPFTGSIVNWTAFNLPINYSASASVKSYKITIILVNSTNTPILDCHIDDLTFDVSTSSSQNIESNINTKLISLDNSQYRILISQDKKYITNLCIYDLTGKKVLTIQGSNDIRQSLDFDLSMYPSGVYYGVVENGNSKQTFKIPLTH